MSKHGKNSRWFSTKEGKRFFDMYQKRLGGNPFRVRVKKQTNESLSNKKTSKKRMDEFFYDFDDVDDIEPKRIPSRKSVDGNMFGSFDDKFGWYDENDREYGGDFDFEYDEESFPDYESLMSKHGKNSRWFSTKEGKRFFDMYQKRLGGNPFRVRVKKQTNEAETEEGNAFSGALAKAKEKGDKSFEVDGKKYPVKEEKKEKKWIQKTGMKKGALHKKLNVPEDEKIPQSKLKSLKAELTKKAKGDKKLSDADSKLLKQVNLALTLKGLKENKSVLKLNEDELIDMIERMVLEQKAKEKENISKKSPEGLKKTVKVQNQSKKENQDYAKEVVEKMKTYLKNSSKAEFQENPESFPESNYTKGGMKEKTMKYHPSQAVDEYIEAFAYPGQTNLVFDEIKPDDKKIKNYLEGDSTTGNATKDKDGKALGNVVPSEVGERFMKNYENNLYGAEQKNVSYKRQPQPVDVGGSEKMEGSLKSIKKGSTAKANKIMNQLESTKDKKETLINEEMGKMKNLITYSRKTQ